MKRLTRRELLKIIAAFGLAVVTKKTLIESDTDINKQLVDTMASFKGSEGFADEIFPTVNEYDEFFGEEFHITGVEPLFKEEPRTICGTQATLYWDGKEIDLAEINNFCGEPDGSTWSGEDDGDVYTVTLHADGVINDDFDFDALWKS